jgi:hypothetical protein
VFKANPMLTSLNLADNGVGAMHQPVVHNQPSLLMTLLHLPRG